MYLIFSVFIGKQVLYIHVSVANIEKRLTVKGSLVKDVRSLTCRFADIRVLGFQLDSLHRSFVLSQICLVMFE
jgi:hypothetical protein